MPISSHILRCNSHRSPLWDSPSRTLKEPWSYSSSLSQSLPQYQTGNMFLKYLANQWRDGSMPHATYSITGLSWPPSQRWGDSPRLERLRPLLPSSFRKGAEKSCLSLVAAQPQPNLLSPDELPSSLPSPASTAYRPRSQSCSLDLLYVTPPSISGYLFPSSLGASDSVLCLQNTPLVLGCLVSPLKGLKRALGGSAPGLKGTSGNYQHPSLSCS